MPIEILTPLGIDQVEPLRIHDDRGRFLAIRRHRRKRMPHQLIVEFT